jgi:diacylglycerol kinase
MKKLSTAFTYTVHGLRHAIVFENNFRIEIFIAFVTVTLSFFLNITTIEWLVVIINIGIVLMAELFNTAIEKTCNIISKEIHPTIKIIKDVSAAAVVVSALCACVCGCIIFFPLILKLINSSL